MTAVVAETGLPKLEKYELAEEIGHGGMATVYRAHDPRLGRDVAVKIIHKHLRDNKEVATRFVAEARAAAKLKHPGIVEVFDVSPEDDRERYLVVELLRGATLRKILETHRDLPPEVGASLVLELCDAIAHAHAASVIHRDIKPENVLVELPEDRGDAPAPAESDVSAASGKKAKASSRKSDASGPHPSSRARKPRAVVVKITDFGIAKVLDAQGVTSTGQVLGSPAHMAPEQIDGGEIDARTDVFGLGVLLYECLVGHLPFEGKNPAQVLRRVLDGTYPPAERERPTVGGRWSAIVARALAKNAVDRYDSAHALGDEIQSELEALGFANPKDEVESYFANAAKYKAAHEKRIVGALVTRGDQARRRGDVTGAAADFNRALAYGTNDPQLVKRITSLSAGASRQRVLRRMGAVALVAATVGLGSYGVARALRSEPVAAPVVAEVAPPDEGPSSTPETSPEGETDASPVEPGTAPTTPPLATGSARPRVPARPSVGGPVTPPPSKLAPRNVRFAINPGGAQLVLDGQAVPWSSKTFVLAPGPHTVDVSVPESKCCKTYRGSVIIEAAPEDKPDEPQRVPIRLATLPASATLRGPAGSRFACSAVPGLAGGAGATVTVELPEALWSGRCTFVSPDKPEVKGTVTLRAGEANLVSFPE